MQDMAFYLEFDEISSVAVMPLFNQRPFCAAEPAVVAVVVPTDTPDKVKEGVFNLVLSKANAETSLLAHLCIAICNLCGWLGR